MKLPERLPASNTATAKERSARSTATLRCLLIALCPMLLAACSSKPFVAPIPPPANLASPCAQLPEPPAVLNDPERAVWELAIIALYAECALKHRALSEAWPSG